MKAVLRFDYATVGHVTVDVLPDGSRRAGGAAFYSALQAARLGLRTLILTRGVAAEIEELLAPHSHELELRVLPSEHTTTLLTSGAGAQRSQRVLAWGGPIDDDLDLDSSILHLAPVARETPTRWSGHSEFVGLTPQGLLRQWPGEDREIELAAPPPASERLADNCNALVLSEHERANCATLIARALSAGALVAVTDGAAPNTVLLPSGDVLDLHVPAIDDPRDDLGAGDVFAAAFFVALADGQAPSDAAHFATAAAAVRMRGEGAGGAVGSREEIQARLRAVSR
ncbi:MAG TPA: PfkB family carbohydrate kinase [Solirubrobacteraceae bacterium]|nr:PfkB family carbohydrate kinase [Solirubrobacteraceae bacterium]